MNRIYSAINQSLNELIKPVNSNVSTELLTFIATLDERLEADLSSIHELIRVSAQQSALIRDLLYNQNVRAIY